MGVFCVFRIMMKSKIIKSTFFAVSAILACGFNCSGDPTIESIILDQYELEGKVFVVIEHTDFLFPEKIENLRYVMIDCNGNEIPALKDYPSSVAAKVLPNYCGDEYKEGRSYICGVMF